MALADVSLDPLWIWGRSGRVAHTVFHRGDFQKLSWKMNQVCNVHCLQNTYGTVEILVINICDYVIMVKNTLLFGVSVAVLLKFGGLYKTVA